MKKVKFRGITKLLRKIPIHAVAEFARQHTNSEVHVKESENRMNIVQMLEETKEMENVVKNIYLKGIKFTEESLSTILKDRQAVYKIRFTFYVRDLFNSASNVMKWFDLNKMNMKGDKDDFFCVIHAIAAGIFKFIQSKVIEIKQNKKGLVSNPEEPTTLNSALSLLTLAGGSFGKIYKCVKRRIAKLRRLHYKKKHEEWRSLIKFRKFMYCLVMTPQEKKNPAIPTPLMERDRGWLFVPKWVFLPYLRLLDQTLNLTAHHGGLKVYGDKLIQVQYIENIYTY